MKSHTLPYLCNPCVRSSGRHKIIPFMRLHICKRGIYCLCIHILPDFQPQMLTMLIHDHEDSLCIKAHITLPKPLNKHIKRTHTTQPKHHTTPKQNIIQQRTPLHPPAPLEQDNRHLHHHGKGTVPAQLLRYAAHDELVRQRADQEGDEGRYGPRDGGLGLAVFGGTGRARRACTGFLGASGRAGRRGHGGVNVAPEEIVDGDIPFAAEFEPVAAVPPVFVERAVGKAGELSECAADVLEDDEEDEQEGDHEWEEESAYRLGEDQAALGECT